MDRRDERMGSQESQSVVKLPLAPIVSIPHSTNASASLATVSTRRGISIFSPTHHPTQTLDQTLPPPQPHPHPHPDPDPTTSTSTTPRNNPSLEIISSTPVLTRYRECQKNHAANMGGHVVDGCGEFMPSGEPGTPESLRCAACDCHRNFHRKEVENNHYQQHQHHGQQHHQNTTNYNNNSRAHGRGSVGPTMVNFGGGPESSSEEMNLAQQPCSYSGSKKRFRTKFSQEQKDKMQELAERLGWRMQKQNEGEVQQLCNELGVKRQVFKVWMHNNKQAMKKRQNE